jgi:hypothetical protein
MDSWKMAVQATVHCLTGCAIGEVLGMVLSSWWEWGSAGSIAVSVVLAFFFGYGLTYWSLRGHGLTTGRKVKTAAASDTLSITSMEITDNLFIVIVPGALTAGLSTALFWWSLLVSLVVAFIVTVPVNKWLISRGKGHAAIHRLHHHS